MRLSRAPLSQVRGGVARPAYDVAGLKPGIVHLGLGAFHRAHQAVFNDDAIAASGGDWGVIGVSMRKPDVAASLDPQDGLYTVETLGETPAYRVVGALTRSLTLPLDPLAVIEALADPTIHIVTLTVTEKGYCLAGDSLDLGHPSIVRDLGDGPPTSAIGVLAEGLAERRRRGAGPVTVISCDNMGDNGRRLGAAVRAFAERKQPELAAALDNVASFPETMVDCIVPASDDASRARVDAAIGLSDLASVQREPFAQWVIENRFAGPRPAWGEGVEIVSKEGDYRRLKLHVLNAAHSALAYLGLRRGHTYVRQAIADADLRTQLEAMVRLEVAPALPELPVTAYWHETATRFANPMIDHRLDQIAQDGAQKLAERIYPVMLTGLAAGRASPVMAQVVRAWLERERPGAAVADALPGLLPPAYRANPSLIAAVAAAAA